MGYDERDKVLRVEEIQNKIINHLTDCGLVETSEDLTTIERIIIEISEFILQREEGYNSFLNGLLEGDFHLETDYHMKGITPERELKGQSLFVPMYSIKRAIARKAGRIIIEKAIDRYGYIIRRET